MYKKYKLHSCPSCTCLTDKQVREMMRRDGHTCIWASDSILNEKLGYTDYNCKICEMNKNQK